jgi:hypothetical protein
MEEFFYKNAKPMKFGVQKDYWTLCLTAVLNSNSSEHKVFKTNLDARIKQNYEETGIDMTKAERPDKELNAKLLEEQE